MNESHIQELANTVTGLVLEPEDQRYKEARSLWNARNEQHPDVILRCRSEADIQNAVNFARKHNILLSVKGGGHAYAANTVGDRGLLIDLSLMKGIEIHPDQKTARVEPGVKWEELDQATQEYGLATTGGTVSTVGVAGFTLGGGTGYLARRFGLAIDNLLSAKIVTSDGEHIKASPDEHPDLFWAIRGGGGNFGVVTSFEFRLHQVGPEVLAGQIVYPLEDAGDVLRKYREFMTDAPDEMQCYAFVLRVPPIPEFPEEVHGDVVLDLVAFHIDPKSKNTFQPLLEFGDPILAFLAPQPYTEVQQAFDAGLPYGQRYESRAHYLSGISDEVIDLVTSQVEDLPGAFTVAYFEPLGGEIQRVDPSATAFRHRDAPYSFQILAGWEDPEDDKRITSWASHFHNAMSSHSTGGVYVNLLGIGEEDRVQAAYNNNYRKLVELKKKWDPDNLFRMNHNIDPKS